MKKLFLFISFVFVQGFAQTLVSTQQLELKKPWDKRQIACVSAVHGSTFYSFASDKQRIYALKYNQALFFRDSLSTTRPSKDVDYIAGTSFDSSGNPFVYWLSENRSKIVSTGFDFASRKSFEYPTSISFEKETFLNAFSAKGKFFLLTVSDEEQKLFLRCFTSGKPELHVLDFSQFELVSQKGKKLKLAEFFEENPLQFIEPETFCPLNIAASAAKLYASSDSLVLSLDHDSRFSQLFLIALGDFSIKEIRNNQPELSIENTTSANSFIVGQSLCQVRFSDKELALSFENSLDGSAEPVVYKTKAEESFSFKSSPLFVQNGDNKSSEIKTTAKFMRRLENSNPGISAYKSPQGILVTCGGVKHTMNTTNVIFGATLGVGIIAAGGGSVNPGDFLDASVLQQIYFESLFDSSFKVDPKDQLPIASDFISEFLGENDDITTYSIGRFGKSEILVYYDSKNKTVVLRKFTDVSSDDFFGN